MDFRGKMRSHKLREEWAEFIDRRDLVSGSVHTSDRTTIRMESTPNTKEGLGVVSTAFPREEDRHFSDVVLGGCMHLDVKGCKSNRHCGIAQQFPLSATQLELDERAWEKRALALQAQAEYIGRLETSS